jgi:hypothetical protein
LLDKLLKGFRDFELFLVERILRFEVYFMLEIFGEPQVIFVNAESVLVFAQNVQVMLMEFLWNLKVAHPPYIIPG